MSGEQVTKDVMYLPPDASKQIADELAHQLGSDATFTDSGLTDIRRLANLNPETRMALIYCAIRSKQNPAFKTVLTWYMNLSVSDRGIGRRDIIRMEAASRSGGNVSVDEHIEKPGWFARNITSRDWEKKERERLGI